MTTLYVDNIAPNLQSKISAPNLTLPSGSVIQVVQNTLTNTQETTTSTSFTDTTLSASITPSSTSSKILVTASLMVSGSSNFGWVRLLRGSTQIHKPALADSKDRSEGSVGFLNYDSNGSGWAAEFPTITLLDEPNSDTSVTYKLQLQGRGDGGSAYINRTPRDSNDANGWDSRGVSTITVMEIAG